MKVALIGSTGVLGSAAVPELVAAGHSVRAGVRDEAKAEALRRAGAETVRADILDAASLRTLVDGADAVINLATRIPPLATMLRAAAWRENDRIRVEGSRLLVEAALAAGARIYVQESITFVYPDRGDEWVDEGTPASSDRGRLASAFAAERQAARFAGPERRFVVLRFSALYGPDSPMTVQLARLVRRRLFPIAGHGRQYQSSIHAADAGAAVAASLTAPAGIYNVTDDEPMPMSDYVGGVARVLRAPPPLRIPAALVRLAGAGDLLLTSQRISNKRLRQAGWAPRYRNVVDGWRSIADEWRTRELRQAAVTRAGSR